jgi:hypothetical protein
MNVSRVLDPTGTLMAAEVLFLFFHPLIFPFNADALLPHFELCVLYARRS